MDDHLILIYLGQVKQECEAALRAVSMINSALQDPGRSDVFIPLQAFVHHTAAVSRIFWPPGARDKHARQRSQRRGELLRQSIGIHSPHVIQARTLRDHLEHFDERLDDWAERSKRRNIVHRMVGPRQAIGGDGIEDGDIIHHFDPAQKAYAFRGEHFDIQALVLGVEDVYLKASSKIELIDRGRLHQV